MFAHHGLWASSPSSGQHSGGAPATTAATVTTTVGAVADVDLLLLIHHVAQAAHCAAQGKVGSGFDVSAAFSGSQRYRRFTPSRLAPIVEALQSHTWDVSMIHQQLVQPYSQSRAGQHADLRLNHQTTRFHLPPGFDMLLGDVSGGSETPGMVKKVLQWRLDAPESLVWSQLGAQNDKIDSFFRRLHALANEQPVVYSATIDAYALVSAPEWSAAVEAGVLPQNDVAECLLALHIGFCGTGAAGSKSESVRSLLRCMGTEAGVGIEPAEQTALLDLVCRIPGVLMAGVPGAGGHDAIFLILLRGDDTGAIGEHLGQLGGGGKVRALQVSRADEGVTCVFE